MSKGIRWGSPVEIPRMLLKFIPALLAALPLVAPACQCFQPESPTQHLSQADVAFTGTAVREEREGATVRTVFAITDLWKGSAGEETFVVSGVPQNSCEMRFQLGERLTILARRNNAQQLVADLCLTLPLIPGPHYDRAIHQSLTDYRNRLEKLKARARSDADTRAWLTLAQFHQEFADVEEAEKAFQRAHIAAPDDDRAMLGLAWVKLQRGNTEDALRDYSQALARDATNAQARRGRAVAMLRLGRANQLKPPERDFSGFSDSRTSFKGLDLQGADFRHAMVRDTDFSGADLRGADFRGAQLVYANFQGAQLADARFSDVPKSAREADPACFKNTRWPNGFDPIAAGAVPCP
jgi:uncharacterized protein YjbI with pentapeptide repeats